MAGYMKLVSDLRIENAALKSKNEVLERTLDKLLSIGVTKTRSHLASEVEVGLRKLTLKQHAAMQMLIRGAVNHEIATRFNVTDSTAKVYVKGVMDKLNARNRSQVIRLVLNDIDAMSEAEYERITGGLPKDWDANYEKYPEINTILFEKTRGASKTR